jgi:hypothetical protein
MIGIGHSSRRGALMLAAAALAAAPAFAFAAAQGAARLKATQLSANGKVAALAGIESGKWQIRDLDAAFPPASICIGDPQILVRFEHRAAECRAEVVEDAAGAATVQYSCAGRGFGHSKVRVQTPRLVRIDTQGLSGGRPFSYRLEAQRTGSC